MPRLFYREVFDPARNHGLDNHLRALIAPPAYRNTMHASDIFMNMNDILEHSMNINPAIGRCVRGARLTSKAVVLWNNLPADEREKWLNILNGEKGFYASITTHYSPITSSVILQIVNHSPVSITSNASCAHSMGM